MGQWSTCGQRKGWTAAKILTAGRQPRRRRLGGRGERERAGRGMEARGRRLTLGSRVGRARPRRRRRPEESGALREARHVLHWHETFRDGAVCCVCSWGGVAVRGGVLKVWAVTVSHSSLSTYEVQ